MPNRGKKNPRTRPSRQIQLTSSFIKPPGDWYGIAKVLAKRLRTLLELRTQVASDLKVQLVQAKTVSRAVRFSQASIGWGLPQALIPVGLGNTVLARVLIKLVRVLHFRVMRAGGK
jgi:hypothetical protein